MPFLHMTPAAGAVCKPLASQLGVVYEQPDVMLEAGAKGATKPLDTQWKRALELARKRGAAVVMLRVSDPSLRWLEGAVSAKRLGGVQMVPLTALMRRAPEL